MSVKSKKIIESILFYLSCILFPPIVWLLPYTSYREQYLFLLLFIGFMVSLSFLYVFVFSNFRRRIYFVVASVIITLICIGHAKIKFTLIQNKYFRELITIEGIDTFLLEKIGKKNVIPFLVVESSNDTLFKHNLSKSLQKIMADSTAFEMVAKKLCCFKSSEDNQEIANYLHSLLLNLFGEKLKQKYSEIVELTSINRISFDYIGRCLPDKNSADVSCSRKNYKKINSSLNYIDYSINPIIIELDTNFVISALKPPTAENLHFNQSSLKNPRSVWESFGTAIRLSPNIEEVIFTITDVISPHSNQYVISYSIIPNKGNYYLSHELIQSSDDAMLFYNQVRTSQYIIDSLGLYKKMNRSPFDSAFSQLPTIIIDKKNATIHPLDSLSKNRDRRNINGSLIIFTIEIMDVYEGSYSNGTPAYGIRGVVSRLFRDGKLKTTRLIDSKSFYDSAPESITVKCQGSGCYGGNNTGYIDDQIESYILSQLNKDK